MQAGSEVAHGVLRVAARRAGAVLGENLREARMMVVAVGREPEGTEGARQAEVRNGAGVADVEKRPAGAAEQMRWAVVRSVEAALRGAAVETAAEGMVYVVEGVTEVGPRNQAEAFWQRLVAEAGGPMLRWEGAASLQVLCLVAARTRPRATLAVETC